MSATTDEQLSYAERQGRLVAAARAYAHGEITVKELMQIERCYETDLIALLVQRAEARQTQRRWWRRFIRR